MIKAVITHNVNHRHYSLDITGHADYAERGKDIVCAGVSALAMAAYYTAYSFAEAGHCEISRCTVGDDAEFHLTINAAVGIGETLVMTIVSTIMHGIESIAKQYPEHVSLKIVERGKKQ